MRKNGEKDDLNTMFLHTFDAQSISIPFCILQGIFPLLRLMVSRTPLVSNVRRLMVGVNEADDPSPSRT